MGIIKEFRDFIKRGNVIDLAVGLIMGAAFGRIVTSLVNDILMPPIGGMLAGINFKDLAYDLPFNTVNAQGQDVPVRLAYGNFIQTLIDFLIISFCIFLLVKGMNTLWKKEQAKAAEPSPEAKLLTEIRDVLKDRSGTV